MKQHQNMIRRRNMNNYMIKFWIENIFGNIFLLLPLGMLLPMLSNEFLSFKKMVSFAFFCSLSIEIIQFLSTSFGSFRTCDIDDVILNTLGAAIGYLIFSKVILKKSSRNKGEKAHNTIKEEGI